MRNILRTSLALVGMSAALVPIAGLAQTAPAGYAQTPPPGTMMIMGQDGKPVAISPGPAPVAGHKHTHLHSKKTVCASCAKKQEMGMGMPGARIVACAHSKNGVCPACRTLLEMPGTVTMGTPAPAPGGEAPGRAVVTSNGPAGNPAMQTSQYASQPSQAVYDPSMTPEPTPIGLMQTNYARPGMMPAAPSGVQGPAMANSGIPTAGSMMPGHSLNESGVNPAPYQHKSTSSANPHVIGHVLGIKGLGAEWREQRGRRKTEAHASIPYNNEGTTINELPSSMVYGKGPR